MLSHVQKLKHLVCGYIEWFFFRCFCVVVATNAASTKHLHGSAMNVCVIHKGLIRLDEYINAANPKAKKKKDRPIWKSQISTKQFFGTGNWPTQAHTWQQWIAKRITNMISLDCVWLSSWPDVLFYVSSSFSSSFIVISKSNNLTYDMSTNQTVKLY